MPRSICGIAVLIVITTSAQAGAQQLVDERTRREALVYYRAGQELLASERFEQAAEQFQKAIGKDPLLALAHYGLGQANMALRRYASAVVAFRGCRDTYRTLAGLALSDSVAGDRRRDDEIRELEDSIRLFQSGKVTTGNQLAMIVKLEARKRELESMRQRDVDPTKPPAEVSLALGSAHFRNGQLEDAEREWKVAIDVNPKLGEAHNNLAALYAMTGRKREAEAAIRAAEKAGFRVNPKLKEDVRRMTT
jgi:tetratricopeptide (TPR) repeat protein